jgi:hypothetical protein
MVKGMANLVRGLILENKDRFENSRECSIREYKTYGMTVRKQLYASDHEERYFHLYYSSQKEYTEREQVEANVERMASYLKKQEGSSLQIRQISAGIRPELVKGTSLEHFQYTFDNYHGSVTNYTIDKFYEFGINKNNEIIDRLANLYKQQLQELKDQGEKLSDTEVKEWEEWLESISTTIVLQKELLPKELKIYSIGIFAPAKDVYNITNIPNVKLVDPYWSGENRL